MRAILNNEVHCDTSMQTYPAGVPIDVPDSWRDGWKPSMGRILEDEPDPADTEPDPADTEPDPAEGEIDSLASMARKEQEDTRKRMGPRTKKRA